VETSSDYKIGFWPNQRELTPFSTMEKGPDSEKKKESLNREKNVPAFYSNVRFKTALKTASH
jgi:hypothetical protein